jgi:phenylacetate-coenzyme A ligase PaaK-like adenylate-forming protein
MYKIDKILGQNPFSFNYKKKFFLFNKYLNELTKYHFKNSNLYSRILKSIGFNSKRDYNTNEIPFIPVRLFKEFDLLSVNKDKIIKTLNSSGTSGSKTSKIYLDKENSLNQVKVLQKIMGSILGKHRLPMLIIDKNIKNINRQNFNARIAAINGFSIFGKDHTFLLDNKGNIEYKILNNFLKKYKKEKFLVFGFTSFIYENLIKKINKKLITSDLHNAILLHGGGWKKLENLKISNKIFKSKLQKKLSIKNIHNYYGLVEQTGSIFIECKCGFFITSDFSDILIRDKNFSLAKPHSRGIVQLLSLVPTSYPGHNILTEDIGEIIDRTKCNCTLEGKRFLIHGRAEKAEIRGCSDV